MKTLFIYPPFGSYKIPALGLSTLKAVLTEQGFPSEILYVNMLYNNKFWSSLYEDFLSSYFRFSLVGNYIFAPYAFPEIKDKQQDFMENYDRIINENKLMIKSAYYHADSPDNILCLQRAVENYLDEVTELILQKDPQVVGFSIVFNQLTASIAIANRLKEKNSSITTIMGGSRCQRSTAPEIARIAGSIDYVFAGEAENELVTFMENLKKGIKPDTKCIHCAPIENLDTIPIPDFSDFFSQLETYGLTKNADSPQDTYRHVFIETNRGCSLSEHGKCHFCAYYYPHFREKSVSRVIQEITEVIDGYGITELALADADVNTKRLIEAFDLLDDNKIDSFHFSTRVDTITFNNLRLLQKKCKKISCLAGIETLNDHLLQKMNKKVTAADNIRFLRDCRTLNINVIWYLLNSIPGEKREDYEQMIRLIPYLHHLNPPQRVSSIIFMQHSTYAKYPDKFNIKNLRPAESMNYIFPENSDKEKLTVMFEGDFETVLDDEDIRVPFFSAVEEWIQAFQNEPPLLEIVREDEKVFVHDTRPVGTEKKRGITAVHEEVLKFFREVLNPDEADEYIKEKKFGAAYQELVEWKYIAVCKNGIVSLVTEPGRCG